MTISYVTSCNVDGCAIIINCPTALSTRFHCSRRLSTGFYGLRAGREKLTGWQWTWQHCCRHCSPILGIHSVCNNNFKCFRRQMACKIRLLWVPSIGPGLIPVCVCVCMRVYGLGNTVEFAYRG
jgi:hypothetical protein